MTRKEAKLKLDKVNKKQSELMEFLNKTCRHTKVKQEQTSDGWDQFKTYRDFCVDCNKTIRTS